MDIFIRYAEADDIKDSGEDGGKVNSLRKGELFKNYIRFQGRVRYIYGANGKRRQQEEFSDLVINININNGNQRYKKNRGYSGKKLRNYNELFKGFCSYYVMADGSAIYFWEDCYVMREFWAEAIKKG